jgi:hypothetical protein
MGHAGALISGGADTADAKLAIMEECGFTITRNPSEMGRCSRPAVISPLPGDFFARVTQYYARQGCPALHCLP